MSTLIRRSAVQSDDSDAPALLSKSRFEWTGRQRDLPRQRESTQVASPSVSLRRNGGEIQGTPP